MGRESRARIIALSREFVPFSSVDALVLEEDTSLLLHAQPSLQPVAQTYEEIVRDALDAQPRRPGSVVVQESRPLRFLAVVYDFERDPPWREQWVSRALAGVLDQAERRMLGAIALPMLGTLPGCLDRARFVRMLRRALVRARLRHLRTLWLIVPGSSDPKLLKALGLFDRDCD